jgi:hypothetical protein
MSALLTLLLAVLFAGPVSASDTLVQRSPAGALIELDAAFGAASLNGSQSARDSVSHEADEDGGDSALLPERSAGTVSNPADDLSSSSADEAAFEARRTNQARAPPSL